MADTPLFARGGFTHLFGKLSEDPINGLKLPVEVDERAKAMAAEIQMPYLEFIRETLTVAVMKRDEVERRFRARLDAIAGTVEEQK